MWIKHVILDLLVTLLIVLATIPEVSWARWIVVGYTGVMIVLKIVALTGTRTIRSVGAATTNVPDWFWHAVYGLNVALLAVDRWWIPAAGWLLIWILSVAFQRRIAAG